MTTKLTPEDIAMREGALKRQCDYPICEEYAPIECEVCGNHFCDNHGTVGGDQQVQDVGAVAFPSQCWECGGFNADA